MKHVHALTLAVFSAATIGLSSSAAAQAYPDKPVRIIVPYPPGGTTDLVARMTQDRLSGLLGQPLIVENRGGATGAIGAEFVARSKPDGYTLLYTPGTDMVLRQYLMKANPVDVAKDFTPIIATIKSTDVIAAHPSLPINSAKELVEYAKRNPGKLAYSTPGVGSQFHLAGELLKMHGVEVVHVPFKGGGPAVQAAVAGQTQLSFGNLTTMHGVLRDGRLKPVALIESKRHPNYPSVATLAETLPGYEMPGSWFAFFGPARVPGAIVSRLNSDIGRVFNAPEIRTKIEELNMGIITGTPEDVTGFIRRAVDSYGKIVKAAGIQPE